MLWNHAREKNDIQKSLAIKKKTRIFLHVQNIFNLFKKLLVTKLSHLLGYQIGITKKPPDFPQY